MNKTAPLELKVVVERAVRPLQISETRKRQMREELLNHLVAILDEEVKKHGNTPIALEQAKRRFGDPGELSNDLRKTIPRSDRVVRLVEKLRIQPGESFLHFVGKHVCLFPIAFAAAVGLVMPIELLKGRFPEFGTVLHILFVASAIGCFFSAGFLFLIDQISRTLRGTDSERSPRTAALYCLAALLILPIMTLLTNGALAQTLPSPGQTLLAAIFAPMVPAMLILISRQAADEIRNIEEWENLDISE